MQSWWLRKIHISWLVACACLGITIGVIAVYYLPQGLFVGMQWLLLSATLLLPLLKHRQMWMILLVLTSGLIFGAWRGSQGQVGLEYYDLLAGHRVSLTGKVLEDPDVDKRGQTVLRLAEISIEDQEHPGSIWVSATHSEAVRRGDIVTVEGKMTSGFGSFIGTMYRAEITAVERPVPGDVAVGVRDWFAERVNDRIPETEAALGLGFLLGLRRALPPELTEVLKIAGLTHVIVASGYNLTILVRLSRRLFSRISKYLAMLSSVAMIVGFMGVTGMSPSMSRAGLVTALSLAAWYYGRKINPLVLLPLSMAITLLINPRYGWGDLGWQLSFAAFAGVIILAPLVQRYFFGDKEPGNVRQVFGETISAQLATLPLLVVAFGVFSNVAIFANLLILPFVPLAMLLVFLVGVFAYVPIIGVILGTVSTWLLGYMVKVASWLAEQSWAQTEIVIDWWQALLIYAALVLAIWWMKRQTKYNLADSSVVE